MQQEIMQQEIMQHEIKEILQQKNIEGNIIRIIGKVYITDKNHGIRAVDLVLDGGELEAILQLPAEEQKAAFITWITPKIEEDYQEWMSSIITPTEAIWHEVAAEEVPEEVPAAPIAAIETV